MANILVFEPDRRFRRVSALLRARGHRVNQTPPQQADAVILGVPALSPQGQVRGSELDFSQLLQQLPDRCLLFGGMFTEQQRAQAAKRGIPAADYYQDETLLQQGAEATAEGALALLITELERTVGDSRIAVLGFGRIGKRLTQLLLSLGASVTVFARSEAARAQASAMGAAALPMHKLLQDGHFHALCNTVPAPVADEAVLAAQGPRALWMELASQPGGISREGAARRGICLLEAPGLPGRFSPESAAVWILQAIGRVHREGEHGA